MLNVVAALQQRCGKVLITLESDVVTTSETDVGTTVIVDRATTLWQRCPNVTVPAGMCEEETSQWQSDFVTLIKGPVPIYWKKHPLPRSLKSCLKSNAAVGTCE